MERHSINEQDAFEMPRDHSRTTNRKLFDTAATTAVVDAHHLLPQHADPGTYLKVPTSSPAS